MARLGSTKRPLRLCVRSEERAAEVAELCDERGLHFLMGLEPDEPEDVSDLEKALNPQGRTEAKQPKPGRNDPCPCGSGKKYKKCCLGK